MEPHSGVTGTTEATQLATKQDYNKRLLHPTSLGISGSTVDVLTSRSTDGGLTWGNPVTSATGSNDKNWVACDGTAGSPHYGNCYLEYDITSSGDSIRMRTSTDGGATWGTPVRVPIDPVSSTADHFVPGIGVDRATSGSSTRIGLTYY